jgi:hypothetical protein
MCLHERGRHLRGGRRQEERLHELQDQKVLRGGNEKGEKKHLKNIRNRSVYVA